MLILTKLRGGSYLGSFFALCILLTTSSTLAGGVDGGGGDVIVCKKGIPFFDQHVESISLADTFFLKREGMIVQLPQVPEKHAISTAIEYFEGTQRGFGSKVAQALSELRFETVRRLRKLKDYKIDVGVKGCRRWQLGIQDLATGTVRYNYELFMRLHPIERGMFKVHEALIRLRGKSGDTSDVREQVAQVLKSPLIWDIFGAIMIKNKAIEYTEESRLRMLRNVIILRTRWDGCTKAANIHNTQTFLLWKPRELAEVCGKSWAEFKAGIFHDLDRIDFFVFDRNKADLLFDKSVAFQDFISGLGNLIIFPTKR